MRNGSSGILLLLFLALAIPVRGQTPSGEISGTVIDASSLPVPGVTITLTNVATNVVRTVQTNESGLYVITAIPPGTYDMKAELSGFGTVERKAILVQVGNAHRIPFTLQVGDLSESIVVQAHSPLIQTENAAISTVIENRAIVELPLNGRNYLQLASLIPGATTNGPSSSQGKQRMGGQRNSFALNVAGQRVHFNHYSLDGVENTDLNFNSYMLLPSVDALEEFNVVSGLFDGSTAAPSRRSTSRRSRVRTGCAVRRSSSFGTPGSTRRTTSTGRTIRFHHSSAISTASRSAVPSCCRRSSTAGTSCSSCSTGRGCARTRR